MKSNTILTWDNTDYKEIYARQLKDEPLYWDEVLNMRVVYSYDFCKSILLNNDAHIPEPVIPEDSLLNEKARLLIRKFARFSNNQQHDSSRQAAMMIYQSMKPVPTARLLESLLSQVKNATEFDWVETICKRLPVLVILKALGFHNDDCDFVTDNISTLVKIMSPNKIESDMIAVNGVVNDFYTVSENYINSPNFPVHLSANIENDKEVLQLFVCNLIGLFIQCYDAGRGILTNSLLSVVNLHHNQKLPLSDIKKMVIETLRFDPPVHNTRRVAVKDVFIGDQLIAAGQSILIVLGAANLDPTVFKEPLQYNPERSNNDQNLTFGLGGHNCLAKYLTIDMAVEACHFFTEKYNGISILQHKFNYEPQLNVRLVKELMIKLEK